MIIFYSNPGKIFLINLGLWWGKNKFSFIYQFLIFLFIMSVFVILYFENQDSELVSFCGLGKAELLLLVLFRIHTISVKYALMSNYKLKFLKYIIVDTSLHYKKDFFLVNLLKKSLIFILSIIIYLEFLRVHGKSKIVK